jgi:hypothetical protein
MLRASGRSCIKVGDGGRCALGWEGLTRPVRVPPTPGCPPRRRGLRGLQLPSHRQMGRDNAVRRRKRKGEVKRPRPRPRLPRAPPADLKKKAPTMPGLRVAQAASSSRTASRTISRSNHARDSWSRCQSVGVKAIRSKPNLMPHRLLCAAIAADLRSVPSGTSNSKSTSLSSRASPRACEPKTNTSVTAGTAARMRVAISWRVAGSSGTGNLRARARVSVAESRAWARAWQVSPLRRRAEAQRSVQEVGLRRLARKHASF